jgi:hypothetical protein
VANAQDSIRKINANRSRTETSSVFVPKQTIGYAPQFLQWPQMWIGADTEHKHRLEAGVAIDGACPVSEELSGLAAPAHAAMIAPIARREAASDRGGGGVLSKRSGQGVELNAIMRRRRRSQ